MINFQTLFFHCFSIKNARIRGGIVTIMHFNIEYNMQNEFNTVTKYIFIYLKLYNNLKYCFIDFQILSEFTFFES